MKHKFPDFFIPGAPKTGTTSLAGWLSSHSNINFSVPKEPRYFNMDFNLIGRPENIDTYLSLFTCKPGGVIKGEATTGYLVSKVAIDNILKINPSAKFIVCLRDPADLFISLHRQRMKEGYETYACPQKAWQAIERRRLGNDIPATCPDPQILDYERYVKLGDQIEILFSKVSKKNIYIVFIEDLEKNAQKTFNNICNFLGVNPEKISSFKKINTALIPKNLFLARIVRILGYIRIKLGLKHGIGLSKLIRRFNLKTPNFEVDPDFYKQLKIELEPQKIKLRSIIGKAPGD